MIKARARLLLLLIAAALAVVGVTELGPEGWFALGSLDDRFPLTLHVQCVPHQDVHVTYTYDGVTFTAPEAECPFWTKSPGDWDGVSLVALYVSQRGHGLYSCDVIINGHIAQPNGHKERTDGGSITCMSR